MEDNQTGKKQLGLNIISSSQKSSKHKGFGTGSINLNNVSPIIIDEGEAKIDVGAMHAKSKVERGIKFTANREDAEGGRRVWLVWVAVDKTEEGGQYAGATACEMWINGETKRGFKILADHVNKLDYAIKRKIILNEMDDEAKAALKTLLTAHNEDWWNRSPDELKEALG
ncbi:YwhD family protein [Saccharibacillus sp. CPCC 101409]|uniref:YwhD family protein n=1 Tax=Saccharibacillus sp. CPCC 101409 TaxID=3058041 RepID=UPI0026718C94|nr:YwhD family protein [Saccharibacillus sp. CPCC 101409]MDO3413147.1 YwhD family protein [Saccharibacillus sp. CPCC 101409]